MQQRRERKSFTLPFPARYFASAKIEAAKMGISVV
jgi:hypothetical protein